MATSSRNRVSVYDTIPLPLGKTMCIRVIKIQPSISPHSSDTIVCNFSLLDVTSGHILGENKVLGADEALVNSGPCTGIPSIRISPPTPNKTKYHALSYTWGESRADWTIVLNGVRFNVRENLWNFLDQARKCRIAGYLWIDAICIDQSTLGERNHQVGMMGDIYSRADSVIIWLGQLSIAQEDRLERVLDEVNDSSRVWNIPARWYEEFWEFGELGYWCRAWIVQEYFLARRKHIWCGRLRIDPGKITWLVSLYQRGPFAVTYPFNPAATQLIRRVDYKSERMFGTFMELLRVFQHSQCVDKRDKVYALLPLLSSEERKDLAISPDYSRSTTSIFLELLSRISGSLNPWQYHWSNDTFLILERILEPKLEERAVQLAILYVKSRGMVDTLRWKLTSNVHHCNGRLGRSPRIGVIGCPICRQKPVVSLVTSVPYDERFHFNQKNWRMYVQALLTSEDEGDRDLGIRYRSALGLVQDSTMSKIGKRIANA